MLLLDSGIDEAPRALVVLDRLRWALMLPIGHPLEQVALTLGSANPLSNPIYWLMVMVNSMVVSAGMVALYARAVRSRERSPERS
jgi:hypothetical protein